MARPRTTLMIGLVLGTLIEVGLAVIFPSPPINWYQDGQDALRTAINQKPIDGVAKNVVLMVGDGMGISTVTAARILDGQRKGRSGEENKLSFETLPNVALSKTFCEDGQVTDSASAASAMMTGWKTNFATIGVRPGVVIGDCASMFGKETESILTLSQKAGKSTGFISTTRLTHATPASAYAQTAFRVWESDADIPPDQANSMCRDIAYQLVYDHPDINVMLSGGRKNFLPNTVQDPEYPDKMGLRQDGRDLFQIWQNNQQSKGRRYNYVWNKDQFDAVNPQTTDYLMGSFEYSYMKFMSERDPYETEPTLTEMVEKAIQILSKNPKGYFLLIEGGTIDEAHHQTNAYNALEETIEYARAAQKVMDMTSEQDTLMVVTSDHSHTLTIGGFPKRGNDIMGLSDTVPIVKQFVDADDGLPYTTLGYHNGIGTGLRVDLTDVNTGAHDFKQGIHVPMPIETHAGEDVGIFSRGPMSYLLRSTQNNNYIFHVMAYASCVGTNLENCNRVPTPTHHYPPKFDNPWDCFKYYSNGSPSAYTSGSGILLMVLINSMFI